MAEQIDRAASFKATSEILAHDANILAQKLKHFIAKGNFDRAEAIASNLQRTARDVKWLIQRQPREG